MKVGLITYHSAYNFGSVLQAFATQEAIKKMMGNCEIINYRTKEQKRVYSIFKWNKGVNIVRTIIKNILIIPHYKNQKMRQEKYERIITKIFNLSDICIEPEDVYKIWTKYDIIISGSDQIWNKNSNELKYVSYKYMYPYLLRGYHGKKVSYASSLVCMEEDDLSNIIDDLFKFDYLSFRESNVCREIKKRFSIHSFNVLDPTFLLNKNEWIKKLNIKKVKEDRYILYYSLGSFKDINIATSKLQVVGQNNGMKVKVVAPLNVVKKKKYIEILENIDPIEFLELIYNAAYIITDSYHGTILSINFKKNFYSVCNGSLSDYRKIDILTRINLESRIIDNFDLIINKNLDIIDYDIADKKLNKLREESFDYLKKALEGDNNG